MVSPGVYTGGKFTLGACRYGLGRTWANQEIEITFDPQTQEFVCRRNLLHQEMTATTL